MPAMTADISLEILKSLRGKRSARAFSKQLGFTSNQVGRWESRHARFTWHDFLYVCKKMNVPFPQYVEETWFYFEPVTDVKKLTRFLLSGDNITSLSKAWGVSRPTLNRWLKGKPSPPAGIILALIEEGPLSLDALVSKIVARSRQTAALKKAFRQKEDWRAIYQTPWMIALACLVVTREFKSQGSQLAANLARALGLDERLISQALGVLWANGIVVRNEKTKEIESGIPYFNLAIEKDKFSSFAHFWSLFATDFIKRDLRSPQDPNKCAFMVFNCDSAGYKKIFQAFAKFYREVETISKSSRGKEELVFVLNMNLTEVKDPALGRLHKSFS
jgi:transcriptional regulator with XRE-family HTH domain